MVEGDAPIASAISQTPPHLGDAGNERFAQFYEMFNNPLVLARVNPYLPDYGLPSVEADDLPPTYAWIPNEFPLLRTLVHLAHALKGTLDKDRHVTDGAQIQGHQVPRRNHNYSWSPTRALCNPT
jgi:hypothetical protein